MADELIFPEPVWAGSEMSLEIARQAHVRLNADLFQRDPPDVPEAPYSFSQQGPIGIVKIEGPLVNSDSPWNKYLGVTSYTQVAEAAMYAAELPGVQAIVLNIGSGGGAVAGVDDTASLLHTIDRRIKPVYAYTGSQMSSAAYWLGSSARKIWNSRTAIGGSIGVIATLKEYSQMMKDAGIGVKVLRAGEFKALASPYEPFSKAAIDQVQAQLDSAYNIFANHVAKMRGVTLAQFEATMGQGREFFGQALVDVGLSDGVMTFDEAIGKIAATLDSSRVTVSNNGNHQTGTNMTRRAMTETEIAAAAAGVQVPDAEAVAKAAAEAKAAEEAKAAAEAKAAEEAKAAADAAGTQPQKGNDEIVTFLRGELKAANDRVIEATIANQALTAKVTAMDATHKPLRAVVEASVTTMRVALNLPKADLNALSTEEVLAMHSSTAQAFTKQFPVGGAAALSATETDDKPVKVNPQFAAVAKQFDRK